MPRPSSVLAAAQVGAAAVALARLSRGRTRRPPLSPEGATAPSAPVSVVVPARDEAARIGPALEALRDDPDVGEVVVVDDRSTDGTADVARALGARVLEGRELPEGWKGKAWAMQQGTEAAAGDVVVTLDADTRPRRGLVRALVAELDGGADLVSVGPRFVCESAGEQLLHPALLATLVYRYGPVGAEPGRADRLVANGQCLAFRRAALLEAGGFTRTDMKFTDDVALVRNLAADGWRVSFADGTRLLEVKMHDSVAETWREWGRSIALHDVNPRAWQAADLAVVWLVQALPVLRLLARRTTRLDRALLAVRVALLPAFAAAYREPGPAFWLSPLADPAAAVRLTLSTARPPTTWRGRTYAGPGGTAGR